MALIKCSECGQMVSDKAPVCPHCGASINASGLNEMTNGFGGTESEGSNVNNNKTWIVLAVIGCVSIVLCIAAWLLFSSEQRQLEYEKQMMEIQRQDSVAQVELQERMRQDSIKQENEKVERMKKIVTETVFGKFVKSCALRDNHIVDYAHIEYYELRLPKGGNMSKFEFKEFYKLCCNHLGFDHQM